MRADEDSLPRERAGGVEGAVSPSSRQRWRHDAYGCRRYRNLDQRAAAIADAAALPVEPEAKPVGEPKIVIPFVLPTLNDWPAPRRGRTAALEEMAGMRNCGYRRASGERVERIADIALCPDVRPLSTRRGRWQLAPS